MPNEQGFLTPEDLRNRPSVPADDGTTRAAMAAFSGLHQASRLTPFPGAPLELPLALKLAFSGLDQAARLTPFLGGPLELSPEWKRTLDAWQEHARRNRDRAQKHVTQDHVAAALPRIDWQVFLRKQRGDEEDAQLVQVLADLGAAFAETTPAAAKLQAGLARELLFFAWADVAADVSFDGDDSEPVDWVNKATGEKFTQPATMGDVTMFFEHAIREENADYWRDFSSRYVERDILEGFWAGYLHATRAAIPEPNMRTVLSGDGTMLIPSTGLILETWRGLNIGARGFDVDASGYPTQRLRQKRNVNASLTMTADSLPAAWDRVKSLGKGSPEAFIGLVAHFMRARSESALWGSYDGYVSRDALTNFRGVKKHNRAYRADDSRDTVEAVDALKGLYINGSHKVWMSAKDGGKRRPVDMLIRGQAFTLDIIPRTGTPEEREAFLASGPGWGNDIAPENIAGWAYKFGFWADCLREGTPQFAKMLEAVTNYPAVQGLYARRLGFVLTMAFRIQAHERNWSQPHLISDLLDDAGIEPERNRARVVERFAVALQELNRDGVIASATYGDGSPITTRPPQHLGGKWFEKWLALGVIVTPPSAIKSEYYAIGQNNPKAAAETAKTQRKNVSRTVKMPPKV